MEKFSLDLLIQNAEEGKVTREIYIEKTLERILRLPLAAFIRMTRDKGENVEGFDPFDCIDEILEIFGMTYRPELCYMDLVCQADICLHSESESEREQAYQAAEPLVRIFYSIYKKLGL